MADEIRNENKKPLTEEEAEKTTFLVDDDELDETAGGVGGKKIGYYLTVGNCNGSYLALRPHTWWDQYHELAQLWPGTQVFTYGATKRGTGLNGVPCSYTHIRYNGMWGWANSAFLY